MSSITTRSPAQPDVRVHGTSLVGLSVAARLARWGHVVELVDTPGQPAPGAEPPITTLPAAWRDLFTKTGQPMAGVLNAAHLELVEAPPPTHRFFDGTEVVLPTDRGAQIRALEPLVGRSQAQSWARLLDRADTLWQGLRRHGTERPFDPNADLRDLLPRTTMGELATELRDPRLVMLWNSMAIRAGAEHSEVTGDSRAPALLSSRWSVERIFGRWHLIDTDTRHVQPLSRLVDLLVARAGTLGVHNRGLPARAAMARAEVDATLPVPPRPRWPWGPAPRVWAPVFESRDDDNDLPMGVVSECVDHMDESGPVVTWRWQGRAVTSTWDSPMNPPAPTGGWTIDTFRHWRDRPPLRVDENHWRGSAASHAGNESWAQLLTGALIAYEVHEHLTGEDIRPTNRNAPTPPRLRPVPRSADGPNTDVSHPRE
ncbi:hypothetical protein ACSDQ9_10985 [Aestuariimicrobium soli]|uniref:hypothetical protein n=1 Tax=Aestuariimicrobium soli TaxID=2035834 RepID=UPI003EBC64C4